MTHFWLERWRNKLSFLPFRTLLIPGNTPVTLSHLGHDCSYQTPTLLQQPQKQPRYLATAATSLCHWSQGRRNAACTSHTTSVHGAAPLSLLEDSPSRSAVFAGTAIPCGPWCKEQLRVSNCLNHLIPCVHPCLLTHIFCAFRAQSGVRLFFDK